MKGGVHHVLKDGTQAVPVARQELKQHAVDVVHEELGTPIARGLL
jgi:hypothetical protein